MIKTLNVVVDEEKSNIWFAQGLELNYAAGGNSFEEVMIYFQEGLLATIHNHLKLYRSFNRLLKPSCYASAWDLYYKSTILSSTIVRFNTLDSFPFKEINFLEVETI